MPMRVLSFLFLFLMHSIMAYALPSPELCNNNQMIPRVIKPLEDWTMIAGNESTVATAYAFSGSQLTFSTTCPTMNQKNKIKIDSRTGLIRITATTKDKFDIIVKATNPCGSATESFNVEIDSEE